MGPEQVPPRVQEAMARLQWQTNGETVEPARDAIDEAPVCAVARETPPYCANTGRSPRSAIEYTCDPREAVKSMI